MSSELNEKLKKRFARYSNKELINRANRDYKLGKNTDDVEFELGRRRTEGRLDYKGEYDELVLIEDNY